MLSNNKNLIVGTQLRGGNYTYQIQKMLGQGSFGITYLATTQIQGPLGDITVSVAIKEFFMSDVNGREGSTVTTGNSGGLFDKYKKKFVKEAQTLSHLHHPNIIHVLETFEANNTVYYSMEYVDCGSLDDLIKQKGKLSLQESLPIILKVADALGYMHSQNMLHLDLKPANIMLKNNGEPVIIDFGLSKQFEENGEPESSTTIGGGTPGYAPLEQSNFKGYDGRGVLPATMDIYALGGTLFKMLTGQRPPDASEIMNEGLPKEEFNQVSGDVVDVVVSAMEPIKRKRIQNANEFIDKLNAVTGINPQRKKQQASEDATIVDSALRESNKKSKSEPTSEPLSPKKPLKKTKIILNLALGVLLVACGAFFAYKSANRPVMTPVVAETPKPQVKTPSSETAVPVVKEKPTPAPATTTKPKSQETVQLQNLKEPIPYDKVQEKPKFKGGGINTFSNWIAKNMIYPGLAKENGIQGVVRVQFVVDVDGKVKDVKCIKGVSPILDNEAVQVVSASPNWEPGRQNGKAVKVIINVPVSFVLR